MAFKYFVLKELLQQRNISLTSFARALGVATPVLSGKGSAFPVEKVEQAIDLLNDWPGPKKARRSQRLLLKDKLKPVTREMLID